MAGVTDRPFRRLVARDGAGLTVSEMVAGEWLANGHEGTLAKVERAEGGVHVVQLVGRDAPAMAEGSVMPRMPGLTSSTSTWAARPAR
ncbi:MAG: tRNA-dihydrouridine synthase [Hyphomicrobiales bacterium]